MTTIQIRQAIAEEIGWINERYDEVGFVHSDLTRDYVAIAEVDRSRAGLGRLVHIDQGIAELGGIFVVPEFRRQGLAASIVRFLIGQSGTCSTIYCLPFAHLSGFYESFGFAACQRSPFIPEEVRNKHAWCNRHFPQPTLLFVLRR
jgi:N-acetylglutamate synthase-like GNAT family acetyltransferase